MSDDLLEKTISNLTSRYPELTFCSSDTFYYSPHDKTVYYDASKTDVSSLWSLLHETGHGVCGHENYFSDVQLLLFEVEAWKEAKLIARNLQLEIDEEYMQDHLDSYRDWLHKRSLCPACDLSSIQVDADTYSCVFCHKRWKVSDDRFTRPYRKSVSGR